MGDFDDSPSTSASAGRIIGRNVTELRYRTPYNEDVFLGEILIAENEENDRKFLLRVFDIEYGVEASSHDWPERTAGNMLVMEQNDHEFELYDKERRLFKVGVCSPLGYIVNTTEFRKPKTIPPHFSKVRKADQSDYEILHQFMGEIIVGDLRSGEQVVPFNVGIRGLDFPSHIGIFATTGMGKSNLMKRLAASVMESGKYGLLILDPHGEYFDGGKAELRGLNHHPMAKDRLVVYSTRDLRGAVSGYNKIKISAQEIEIDDLMQLYDFSSAQRNAFNSARRVYHEKWLMALLEQEIEDLVIELAGTFEGTLGVIKRRLMNLFKSNILTKDKTISISDQIYTTLTNGKVVLVDTSNMGEAEELLVSIVLARSVFERNKRLFADPDEFKKLPEFLITLEEAQRVLGNLALGGRNNIFATISREGRKFKTGLCAISQQPKLINEEIISQFNTLFILGLADKGDRNILRDSAKQDVSQLSNEIQMLMPGEALITSPFTPFAMPVKIHLYEDYLENISQRGGDQNSPSKENEEGESDDIDGNKVENKDDDGFF
ncbi:MAG: ATP-binding protein [Thermoplasmata archaeon]|nr:ATP-binding protein [Thermoplasmata archaeon]